MLAKVLVGTCAFLATQSLAVDELRETFDPRFHCVGDEPYAITVAKCTAIFRLFRGYNG